ncbi:MAG: hypothetical protein WD885_02355 [Candidatus Saccharimonadales bacterium]
MSIFAYLDPGTGSLVIQSIIGAVLAIGVLLKTFWSRIVALFSKDKKPAEKPRKSSE